MIKWRVERIIYFIIGIYLHMLQHPEVTIQQKWKIKWEQSTPHSRTHTSISPRGNAFISNWNSSKLWIITKYFLPNTFNADAYTDAVAKLSSNVFTRPYWLWLRLLNEFDYTLLAHQLFMQIEPKTLIRPDTKIFLSHLVCLSASEMRKRIIQPTCNTKHLICEWNWKKEYPTFL